MVAERAGECFVRAVVRVQRQGKDIWRAAGERPRGLAEASRTHVAHHGQPRRGGERPHHVETRDSRDASDLVEGQFVGEMAFDRPERLLGRIHGSWSWLKPAHYDRLPGAAFDSPCSRSRAFMELEARSDYKVVMPGLVLPCPGIHVLTLYQ